MRQPFCFNTECRLVQLFDCSSCAFGPFNSIHHHSDNVLGVYRLESHPYLSARSPQVPEAMWCLVQATSSSVGVNPIQVDNGPIKVLKAHMMLSTFGVVNDKEAGTMTHAHTFGGR